MSKEISPSTLPKLAECALFEGASGTSAAAERGTAVDLAIRNLIAGNELEPMADVVGFDFSPIAYGVEELKRLAKGSFVETREEYLAMAVPGLSKLGTADAVCKEQKWVADIKTGQVRDYRNQLQAYALACMEDNFETSWTAHVIYVDQKMIRSYDFTYEEAKQGTQRTIDRATSADAKPTPSEYCSWCKHFNNCHAIVRQAESAIALIPEATGNSIEAIKDRILSSPESLGAFIREWKLAEKEIAEPLLGHLKTRLESGDEVAGWKLTSVSGRRFVEAEAIAKAAQGISKETLILAMGGKLSEKSYIEFCANNGVEPDTTAIKAGAPTTQLRQTKVK
jgi:CRISPR/Cas system-associated exonuclease Cas4 (RecB family)